MYFPGFSYFSEPRYQQRPSTAYYPYRRTPSYYTTYDDSTDEEDDYDRLSQSSFFAPQSGRKPAPQSARRAAPAQTQKAQQQQKCTCNCGQTHTQQPQKQSEAPQPTSSTPNKNNKNGYSQKQAQFMNSTGFQNAQKQQQKEAATQATESAKNLEQKIVQESPIAQDDISTDDETYQIENLNINYWEEVGVSPTKNNLDDLLIEEYFSPEVENKAKQLESVLKKPFRECLHLVQENPNESISSLIQIAIKKYTAAAAAAQTRN